MKNLISICIIGKNEEKNIVNCLNAVKDWNLPIIYTDTGSSDQTVAIAKQFTDKVYFYKWDNNFSNARNFCANQAPTDWIWVIDCDEYLESLNPKSFFDFCSSSEYQTKPYAGMILQKDQFLSNNETSYATTRLSRIYNKQLCHYEGAIHEQIVSNDLSQPINYYDIDAVLAHHSYADASLALQKANRNISILQSELEKCKDPYFYYQLGKAYQSINRMSDAAIAYEHGLSFDLNPEIAYVQSMVVAYGYTLLDLRQYKDALSFKSIYNSFNNYADFVFLMGLIYMKNAFFKEAVEEFKKATTFCTSTVDGVNSYKAFYNIGIIYECLGQIDSAIEYYKKCGNYTPAQAQLDILSKE